MFDLRQRNLRDFTMGNDEIVGHGEIQTLNNCIRNFANQKHYTLVDYHSALADDRGYDLKGLTTDGVHPGEQGYERMEPLLREAIQNAIRGRQSIVQECRCHPPHFFVTAESDEPQGTGLKTGHYEFKTTTNLNL